METEFKRLDFKPLVFGTFGEASTNVKTVVDMAVEYVRCGALGAIDGNNYSEECQSIVKEKIPHAVEVAVWRGHTNLILDMID